MSRMEEAIGLGFRQDATASSSAAVGTTRFVSSSSSCGFPPPPPHPSTIQSDNGQSAQSMTHPLTTSSTHGMHQNILHPPPRLPSPIAMPVIQVPLEQQMQSACDPIVKARAIAKRFHVERELLNRNIDDNKINYEYADKRKIYFQNEKLLHHKFTLKNLEYVMKHEESELRSHVKCMNEITEWEEQQDLQMQQIRQQQREKERRLVEQRGGGGIGSNDQRYVERIRKRQNCKNSSNTAVNQQPHQQSPKRASIYLSNLPTDGSVTERTLGSLFCVYGPLDRVTMYRNRSSGELKGDGLIVFGINAKGNNQQIGTDHCGGDLVETVCKQMNGAELPCGTVIDVEPADMNWRRNNDDKAKKSDHHQVQLLRHSSTATNVSVDKSKLGKETSKPILLTTEKNKEGDDEEDLNDFFASLE